MAAFGDELEQWRIFSESAAGLRKNLRKFPVIGKTKSPWR
jgi:hypothetical protein